MKTYIAITVCDKTYNYIDNCLNGLLLAALHKEIHIFDATENGLPKEVLNFCKLYNRFGVFVHRVKAAKGLKTYNSRKNRAILDSIHNYKAKTGFIAYIHINPNILFPDQSLQILSDNSQLYSCLSPIISNINGIEVIDGIASRYDFDIYDKGVSSVIYITGQIEESFAINHKCFALSDRYIKKTGRLWQSSVDPNDYINAVFIEYGIKMPSIDTYTFVHEELY